MPSRLEFLLPSGCPPLASSSLQERRGIANLEMAKTKTLPVPVTTVFRMVEIGNLVNVNYLSGLLGISPTQIVDDLTELGRRPGACQTLTYDLAAMVAVRRGFYPVKVG